MMELEVGDIVTCIVERIVGTVVFVKILFGGKELEGSIIISEIAPGRIRNLRDYVVPKKRIVCKILRISSKGNIELSLRRVTPKEKKEAVEQEKQERNYISILKRILGDKFNDTIKRIKEKEDIYGFLQKAKENPKPLEKLIGKENSKKIIEILKNQKQKKVSIKKEIILSTTHPNGLEIIKQILSFIKDAEVKYISAGRYSIKIESTNPKEADYNLKEIFSNIDKIARQKEITFNIK